MNNIESIKEVSKALLYLDVEQTNIPFLVYHPYFESNIATVHTGKGHEIVELKGEGLKRARDMIEKQIERAEDVYYLMMLLRKPYRMLFLKMTKDYMDKDTFSKLFAETWVQSENPNQDVNVSISTMKKFFRYCNREKMMSEEDYEIYKNLPETFEIFRGVAVGRNPKGLSWTCNIEKAKWFAHRFDENGKIGYIQRAVIDKKNVLSYFNTRGEEEIVADTSKLKIEKYKEV